MGTACRSINFLLDLGSGPHHFWGYGHHH